MRVTQSRLTLCGPMDCSPPDSSVHGILQGKDTGVSPGKNPGVACHFLLQGMFPTQGLNPGLLLRQVDSLPSEPAEKPRNGQRNHSCWPHRLVLYKKTGFHFPCKLTGCPVPRLPGIHASRSGWEIHKVSWGPLISPVGMKAIKERLFHVQGHWGWSQGLPRSAMMLSKNADRQWRGSHEAHQMWPISDFLYYRKKGRDRERGSCITFGGNQNTESLFQKLIFEN